MELNEANLNGMVTYLQQTLSHDSSVRQPAEKFLQSVEDTSGYPLLLLHVVDQDQIQLVVRIAAAITFKNFVKRNWVIDEDNISPEANRISENDRQSIKQNIIGLMLKREEQIQKQLSDAVSIIGHADFPDHWPTLLDELIQRIQTSGGNFAIINGILQTCHSLFKRFRHEFKSQQLWTVIKYVLDKFAKPFTDLFVATVEFGAANATNPEALKIIFSSLVLCSKIFYSLNVQDLPEFFEDNLKIWMPNFLNLLGVDNQLLRTTDSEEAGLLEQLKSEICHNISLYAQKYGEEFEPYLPGFVQSVWSLLVGTSIEPKYDLLVSNAINFISTVAFRPQFKELFEAEGVLVQLCSKVIIPNIQFRQAEEELFEDNPEEYIRMDIEGSDVDTRRRAACDLIKSLSKSFEQQITQIFSSYVQGMLQEFQQNPGQNWKNKDSVYYLVTAMSVKGSTSRFGTTQVSEFVNLLDFWHNFVKSDIQNLTDVNSCPVLRADALKYLVTFRNYLPHDTIILPSISLIIAHLGSSSVVVHSYAAHCIERLLTVNALAGMPPKALVRVEDFGQYLQQTITGLFGVLQFEGSQENVFAMRALMKCLAFMQERTTPYLEQIVATLSAKLRVVLNNPTKPHFNHYLFESIALCITISQIHKTVSITHIEQTLMPAFEGIFAQDVQEFTPYVFQILSLMIELRGNEPISEFYEKLLPLMTTPGIWERTGNVLPASRLQQAFWHKAAPQILAANLLQPILGVFQKLMSSKRDDHEGYQILNAIILNVDYSQMSTHLKTVFFIIFNRLTNSKTAKFVSCTLVFFSLFAHRYGTSLLESKLNEIQPNMFAMVVDRLYVEEAQKLDKTQDKKTVAIGMTKLLCELPSMFKGENAALWPRLLEALIKLFEKPEEAALEELIFDDQNGIDYQAMYCKLQHGSPQPLDPFAGIIPDARIFLANGFASLLKQDPARLRELVAQCSQETQTHLQRYLSAANINIA